MGKYKTLAKNTIFVAIGTVGSKVISIVMLPLYTRWLSADEFGTVDAMTVYSTLLMGILSLCIAESIFVFPKNKENSMQTEYYSSGLLFCLFQVIIGFVIFYIIKTMADGVGWDNVFSHYIWYIYGLTVSALIQAYCQAFARSIDKMLQYSITGMVQTFSIAIFSFILIPYFGLRGFALAYILANVSAALYSFVSTMQYRYISLKKSSRLTTRKMLNYSVPMIPNNVMWWLIGGFSRPVIEFYLNTFSLGIYAVANKFSSMLHSLFSIFGMSWFNSALDEYGKPDFERFYNNCLKMVFTFLMFGSFVIIMFCQWIVTLLTTSSYYTAYKYIPCLLLSVIFSATSGVVGCIFACVKKSGYYFYSSIWGGASSVISMLLLTPLWGLAGAVISVLISHLVILSSRIIYSNRYVTIWSYVYYIFLMAVFIGFTINMFYGGDFKPYIYILLWIIALFFCKNELQALFCLLKAKLDRGNSNI